MIHHSWLGKSKHCFITRDLANPNISSLATRLRLVARDEIFGFASSLVMKQCFDLPRHSWYIIYPNFHFHKWYISKILTYDICRSCSVFKIWGHFPMGVIFLYTFRTSNQPKFCYPKLNLSEPRTSKTPLKKDQTFNFDSGSFEA